MIAEVGDRYRMLVGELPLVPIRDGVHYEAALEVVLRLMRRGESRVPDETGYLEVLAMLVERFEAEHDPRLELRGVAFLRHLLEANGLPQRAIAPELGGESVVSEIIAGRRKLNTRQITCLAERFGVSPALFIDLPAVRGA